MGGFRVVNKSSLAIEIETDLPPSRRNVHPSGVLHAKSSSSSSRNEPDDDDVFVWVENCLHVESAIDHLERMHDRRDVVFIPYSRRENWMATYPQAAFDLEYGDDGEREGRTPRDDDGGDDLLLLPDAERDELHLEIWNYLRWFHDRLAAAEADAASEITAVNAFFGEGGRLKPGPKKGYHVKKNRGVELSKLRIAIDRLEEAFVVVSNAKLKRAEEEEKLQRQRNQQQPLVELERTEEGGDEELASDAAEAADLMAGAHEVADGGIIEVAEGGIIEKPQSPSQSAPSEAGTAGSDGVPFLQASLSAALYRRVTARELKGEERRGCKRPRTDDEDGPGEEEEGDHAAKKVAAPPAKRRDFDEMFGRLLEYREEHGDCLVPKDYEADPELPIWVRCLRLQRAEARRKNMEAEDPPSDKRRARILNAERISRLDGIGFAWTVQKGPYRSTTWQDYFDELMEYYRENGRWPPSTVAKLGSWIATQRLLYAKKDAIYMRLWAPKLDEVGFEWAPVTIRETLISCEDRYGDSHINLPRPRNGNEYRKPEAVAILSLYGYKSIDRGLAMDKMIRLGYVPCTVRTLRRLMERRNKGQPIPDTDWHQSVGPRTKNAEATTHSSVGFESAPVRKRKTLISSEDPYGDSHINLPRPRNGNEYRKPEAVAILSLYGNHSKDRGLAMDKMIRLGYVPCMVRTMGRLMERRNKGQPIPDTNWHKKRIDPRTKNAEAT